MASELHVDAIKHSGGTSALTIDSSGNVHMAGAVLQTVIHAFSDTTTNSTDSNADLTGSSFSFTPKFASSLLLISISVSVRMGRNSASGQGCTVNVVHDGTAISEAPQDYELYVYAASGGNHIFMQRLHKEVTVSASNTNARTIKLQGRPNATGDSGSLIVNNASMISTIKVTEIAQ